MKISILTLFPNMFDGFLNESIIKRAIDKKKVEIEIINYQNIQNFNEFKDVLDIICNDNSNIKYIYK